MAEAQKDDGCIPFSEARYGEWVQYHCDLMIVHEPEFVAHLTALYELWLNRDVTIEELEEASESMVFADGAQGLSWRDHARFMWGLIRTRRPNPNNVTEQRLRQEALKIAGKIGKE